MIYYILIKNIISFFYTGMKYTNGSVDREMLRLFVHRPLLTYPNTWRSIQMPKKKTCRKLLPNTLWNLLTRLRPFNVVSTSVLKMCMHTAAKDFCHWNIVSMILSDFSPIKTMCNCNETSFSKQCQNSVCLIVFV